jgi:hypothetical protein
LLANCQNLLENGKLRLKYIPTQQVSAYGVKPRGRMAADLASAGNETESEDEGELEDD